MALPDLYRIYLETVKGLDGCLNVGKNMDVPNSVTPFCTIHYTSFNPLTPKVYTLAQCHAAGILNWGFKFLMPAFRKKDHIEFAFRFKEMKFRILFMNWLTREKMFTHFNNIFGCVNCMYYLKWSVSILLHNSGCCRSSVVYLGHSFVTTHSLAHSLTHSLLS
jgi:hypothetical protein